MLIRGSQSRTTQCWINKIVQLKPRENGGTLRKDNTVPRLEIVRCNDYRKHIINVMKVSRVQSSDWKCEGTIISFKR